MDAMDKIRQRGYAVSLTYDKTTFVATARGDTGKSWTVRATDDHAAIAELAAQLGVDLAAD